MNSHRLVHGLQALLDILSFDTHKWDGKLPWLLPPGGVVGGEWDNE